MVGVLYSSQSVWQFWAQGWYRLWNNAFFISKLALIILSAVVSLGVQANIELCRALGFRVILSSVGPNFASSLPLVTALIFFFYPNFSSPSPSFLQSLVVGFRTILAFCLTNLASSLPLLLLQDKAFSYPKLPVLSAVSSLVVHSNSYVCRTKFCSLLASMASTFLRTHGPLQNLSFPPRKQHKVSRTIVSSLT